MKTDLIKTYEGHLILPFGTPYIITTAWETATQYHTQSFSFLDCLDHTVYLVAHYQPFPKSVPKDILPGSLTKDKALQYCLNYGYDMAYKGLPKSFWNYGYKKIKAKGNFPTPNAIKLLFEDAKDKDLVILTHLLRRDKQSFEWMEKQAKTDLLKALMAWAKKIDIQVSESYKSS